MKATVVFPIADLRRFSKFSGLVSSRPTWSIALVGKDFVRALGGLRDVPSEEHLGEGGWIVEPFFCDTRRAFRFPDMPALSSNTIQVVRRGFFFDRVCSSRVEYQFRPVSNTLANKEMDAQEICNFITNLDITINSHFGPNKTSNKTFSFGLSGIMHARAIAERTVLRAGFEYINEIRQLVRACRPSIFIELEHADHIHVGSEFIKTRNTRSKYISLYHDRSRVIGSFDVPIWIIQKKKKLGKADARSIPLYLKRFHCEQEVLKSVLRATIDRKISLKEESASIDLEEYVEELLRRVRRTESKMDKSYKFSEEPEEGLPSIADLVLTSLSDVEPSFRKQLVGALDEIGISRKSVKNQIEAFAVSQEQRAAETFKTVETLNQFNNVWVFGPMVDKSQSVQNSTGVALNRAGRDAHQEIQNSFNQAQQGAKTEDIVRLLSGIKEEIAKAIDLGEANDPKETSRDFKELSEEIVSDNPRKTKIEMLGKMIVSGIKAGSSAAKNIAKIIESINQMIS